jgi:methionyl-tRNA formyltransferase
LPDYRGNHCFFFALYNCDFNKIGSTIHSINTGIDKGDIISHVVPDIFKEDNPETLYSKAEKEAIHKLSQLINTYEQGEEFPKLQQQFYGKLYKTRDRGLRDDIMYFVKRCIGRYNNLPSEKKV